jgi:hypothetical protein
MFNNDFDPLQELLETKQANLRLQTDLLILQQQLHSTVIAQGEVVRALNNQAKAINSLKAMLLDHIETTYQPK